jgi:hypothetical protein
MSQTLRFLLLALLVVLAGIEKLASIMNLISVERDWVSLLQYYLEIDKKN